MQLGKHGWVLYYIGAVFKKPVIWYKLVLSVRVKEFRYELKCFTRKLSFVFWKHTSNSNCYSFAEKFKFLNVSVCG